MTIIVSRTRTVRPTLPQVFQHTALRSLSCTHTQLHTLLHRTLLSTTAQSLSLSFPADDLTDERPHEAFIAAFLFAPAA